jgi:serine/threonine protein kinase
VASHPRRRMGPLPRILDFGRRSTHGGPLPIDTLIAAETLVRSSARAPAPAEPVADPVRVGRYEVRGVLGEGSMCRVYRAYDPREDREVAVKVLKAPFASDPRVVARFRGEAAVGRRFDHPALVDLLDAGSDYLVQELVEGETLAGRLRRLGPIRPETALPILAAVAEALDHVHSHAVVHRDVKPSNVLLAHGGAAKLADFGIARLGWAPITRTGEVIGTPAYMAPEQLSAGVVHAKSDLYSLAVVAHETLTGARLFDRRSLGALLQSIVADEPPRASAVNPALPAAVDLVLAKALAKDPARRYARGRAFVTALRDACGRAMASRRS